MSSFQSRFLRRRPTGALRPIGMAFLFALFSAGLSAQSPSPSAPPAPPPSLTEPTLEVASVPAAGRAAVLLTVPRATRLALRTMSEVGVALRLVDRMTGPGAWQGSVGSEDGRLDVTLDAGIYRVETHGPEVAKGVVALRVDAFERRETFGTPTRYELMETTLGDLEDVAWRVEVSRQEAQHFEIGGRHLSEVSLWSAAGWKLDAKPICRITDPRKGKPIRVCRLGLDLEPGLYEVVASGGKPLEWAEDDGRDPLWLRSGIQPLPEAGRVQGKIGPFGVERFVVDGKANYLRLERPDPGAAILRYRSWNPSDPIGHPGQAVSIEKESVPPVAEAFPSSSKAPHLLEIEAPFAQPWTLTHFQRSERFAFEASGAEWVSVLQSADPRDVFDPTGLVINTAYPSQIVAGIGVEIGPGQPWSRRAPLLQPTNVHVRVLTSGRYRMGFEGGPTRGRLVPVLFHPPEEYEPPPWGSSGDLVDVEAGWYLLEVEPTGTPGIRVVELRAEGDPTPVENAPLRSGLRWSGLRLARDVDYAVVLNRRPGVYSGLIRRPLPLTLQEELPVAVAPGETFEIAVTPTSPGFFEARSGVGGREPISLDGQPTEERPHVSASRHRFQLEPSDEPRMVTFRRSPPPGGWTRPVPLPVIEEPALLAAGDHRPIHLEGANAEVFRLRAGGPSLVRVETTGLLDTVGQLRTRVVPEIARSTFGGSGRNFLLQQVLREGEFLVTVGAEGRSAGPAGLAVTRTQIRDEGRITAGIPARATVREGEALGWTFELSEPRRVRLQAIGLGRRFATRLEDIDGWPVLRPGTRGLIDQRLEPGTYRYVVLPEAVDSRVLATLELDEEARRFDGHGPHPLELDLRQAHRWTEPEVEGAPRDPDRWVFDLPAPARVSLRLSDEMQARLLDSDGTEVATLPPGRPWEGPLLEGRHTLEVVCARVDNRVDYEVRVAPIELVEGLEREVQSPAEIPLSLGTDAAYEMTTFGDRDVRAILLDEEGRRLASADDRLHDWNPLLVERLAAGRYRLRVEPVADRAATVRVALRRLETIVLEPLGAPGERELALSSGEITVPLALPEGADALVVEAEADEPIRLDLERREQGGAWQGLGGNLARTLRLEAASGASAGAELRLRLAAPDRRGGRARLRVSAGSPPRFAEGDPLRAVPIGRSEVDRLAWWVPGRAGCFRFAAGTRLGLDGRVAENREGVVAISGEPILLGTTGRSGANPERVAVEVDGASLVVRLAPGGQALCDLGDGPRRNDADRWVRFEAEAVVGTPGVASSGEERLDRGTAVSGARAVALAQVERGDLHVWLAKGDRPTEVRVTARSVASPGNQTLDWGVGGMDLEAGQSARLELPIGRKNLRLGLGVNVVARLEGPSGLEASWWGGPDRTLDEVVTTGDGVLRVAAGDRAGRVRWEILPAAADADGQIAAEPRSSVATATRQRLEVGPGSAGRVVELRGVTSAAFLGSDGLLREGTDRISGVPSTGGVLVVEPAGSPWWAWVEADRGAEGGTAVGVLREVELPTREAVSRDGARFLVTTEHPMLVEGRTSGGGVLRLSGRSLEPRSDVHAGAASFAAWSRGQLEVEYRALGADAQILELFAQPAMPLGEGVGPATLLGGGQRAVYSFRLGEDGRIGFGVRADADSVTAVLLASDGSERARGVLRLLDLEAGDWILLLEGGSGEAPVEARPILIGVEPPSEGPPPEVARDLRERLVPGEGGGR